MGLRELKEVAHQQFVRGKFAQCAQTYHQILRLAPRDPNMRVRHAEACRRSGDRLQAIASYRAAAELLLELGCESRARGALKAALELDPRDPLLQADVARLGPQQDEPLLTAPSEPGELPLLPPLESGVEPASRAPRAHRPFKGTLPEDPLRTTALPPIQRALPAVPSVAPLGPPVLLPAPRVPSAAAGMAPAPAASRVEKLGAAVANAARTLPPVVRRPPSADAAASASRRPTEGPGSPGFQPPVLHPATPSALPPRSAAGSTPAASAPAGTSLPSNSVTTASQAQALCGLAAPEPSTDSRPRLEVRRLSATSLAFRCSPQDNWAVIRSHTPLEMHLVENLEQLPPMLRDFTVDITVETELEAASDVVH